MKVFITRNIKETDFFKTALEKVGFTVFGQSLIEFLPILFDKIPECDWLFFYSKNGVKFFFDQLDKEQFYHFKNKKIGTIGEGTARFLIKNYQLNPNFVGTGEPLQTAKAFAQIAVKQKILFPRAKQSKKSIQIQLLNVIKVVDLIVYENRPIKKVKIPEADFLVFTSPLNAQTYFKQHSKKKNQVVIAIGNTTANALYKIDIEEVIVADEPSEEGLINSILNR